MHARIILYYNEIGILNKNSFRCGKIKVYAGNLEIPAYTYHYYCNCFEPISKTLRVSSMRRIRQIRLISNMLMNVSIHRIFEIKFAWL